ncbi:hypothetical protein GH714_028748 [Hevea brasiliensis]|uniref:tRNA synthetases class I catalytic domain-containing protein n=1 Tax=Hevea brasiliensis TaxID=3981 RepID=A0A6A6NDB0_HEVBR|nr:hypothetical protein GH714_028748 [Hevea brasiliensis]
MIKTTEDFKPLVPGKVGMYVCGVTSYDLSHIGHARAAVVFDSSSGLYSCFTYVIFLMLHNDYEGYEVTYVRNFTDIDDKIIHKANELGEDPLSLSNRFCEEYLIDMDSLQCLLPTHQPRVTDHMEQIKDMITQIINNGFAYVVEGDVFFAVDKFPNYGQLSGQKLENTRAGERVAVDTRKRNPADFALWKAAKPGEPSWESPWGPGRPGWHIECSAMSAHYLTFKFDIHGGGSDLAFPHHENEITQSAAACQKAIWKPEGGCGTDVKKVGITADAQKCINKLREEFETKMSDDLSTSHILIGAFQEALKFINSSLSMLKVLQQLKEKALKRAGLTEQDVLGLIEERAIARKNKDFSRSDRISVDLTAKGVALMDVGRETVWRPCVPFEPEQDAPSVVVEQNPPSAVSS